MKTMLLGKLKITSAMLLLVLVCVGGGTVALLPRAAGQAEPGKGGDTAQEAGRGRVTDPPSALSDLKRFIGTWKVQSTVVNGRALPKGEVSQNDQVIYDSDGGWQQQSEGQTVSSGVIAAVDTAARHRAIDYRVLNGGTDVGKAIRAIYEFEDNDTYRICYAGPDKERPADFSGKEGSGHTVCVLKRVKTGPAGGREAAPAAREGESVKRELEKLEGTWVAVGGEFRGTETPEQDTKKAGHKLVISGDTFAWYTALQDEPVMKGTVKIDPAKRPKAMDLSFDRGGDAALGRCIYELDGDALKLCYGEPDRPAGFKTKEDSGDRLYVWKREKK
jgi:uncharacterized protein (TIGR03067 family)